MDMKLVSLLEWSNPSNPFEDKLSDFTNYWWNYNALPIVDGNGIAKFRNTLIGFNLNYNSMIKDNLFNGLPWVIDFKYKIISVGNNSLIFRTADNNPFFWYWGASYSAYNMTNSDSSIAGVDYANWHRFTVQYNPAKIPNVSLFLDGKRFAYRDSIRFEPSFYIGGNDVWKGGGYVHMDIQPIAIFTGVIDQEFDFDTNFLYYLHSLYANQDTAYYIPKEVKS